MQESLSWSWIEEQTADTIALWHSCAERTPRSGVTYSRSEQHRRERLYDRALAETETESEARAKPATAADRAACRTRTTACFARFSAEALDLNVDAVRLLTEDFIPVGTALAQWARKFDPELSVQDIVQAC